MIKKWAQKHCRSTNGMILQYNILTAKILSKKPLPGPPWCPPVGFAPPSPYPPAAGLAGIPEADPASLATPVPNRPAPAPAPPAPYPELAPSPLPPAEATALPSSAKEAEAWKPPNDAPTDSPFLTANPPDGMISYGQYVQNKCYQSLKYCRIRVFVYYLDLKLSSTSW